MIIGFLSDVHANLPALRSALAAAGERGAEQIVVCGDIVGFGPFPEETVELLRAQPSVTALKGNVDRKVLREADRKRKKLKEGAERGNGKRRNLAWSALQLSQGSVDWLKALPDSLQLRLGGEEILAVHGTPLSDTDYLYPSITDVGLAGKLDGHDGPRPTVLVAGHSHLPFTSMVGGVRVANCGSVGLPADGDPRGSMVLLRTSDGEGGDAEVIRFHYPVEETEAAVEMRRVPGVPAEQYRRGVKLI